jgi:hypothetical protein
LFALVLTAFASAQSDALVIKGGTVHPKPTAPAMVADVLIEKGVIKAIGPNLAPPEGATIVDATGLHVFPAMIDAFNTGLLEASSAAPGRSAVPTACSMSTTVSTEPRRRLLAAGVGVVGLGSAMGRAPAAAVVSVAGSTSRPSVLHEDAVVPLVPASMTPAQAPGGAPAGPANRATASGRAGISKSIDDALEGAKKYREAKEKYEKISASGRRRSRSGKRRRAPPNRSRPRRTAKRRRGRVEPRRGLPKASAIGRRKSSRSGSAKTCAAAVAGSSGGDAPAPAAASGGGETRPTARKAEARPREGSPTSRAVG